MDKRISIFPITSPSPKQKSGSITYLDRVYQSPTQSGHSHLRALPSLIPNNKQMRSYSPYSSVSKQGIRSIHPPAMMGSSSQSSFLTFSPTVSNYHSPLLRPSLKSLSRSGHYQYSSGLSSDGHLLEKGIHLLQSRKRLLPDGCSYENDSEASLSQSSNREKRFRLFEDKLPITYNGHNGESVSVQSNNSTRTQDTGILQRISEESYADNFSTVNAPSPVASQDRMDSHHSGVSSRRTSLESMSSTTLNLSVKDKRRAYMTSSEMECRAGLKTASMSTQSSVSNGPVSSHPIQDTAIQTEGDASTKSLVLPKAPTAAPAVDSGSVKSKPASASDFLLYLDSVRSSERNTLDLRHASSMTYFSESRMSHIRELLHQVDRTQSMPSAMGKSVAPAASQSSGSTWGLTQSVSKEQSSKDVPPFSSTTSNVTADKSIVDPSLTSATTIFTFGKQSGATAGSSNEKAPSQPISISFEPKSIGPSMSSFSTAKESSVPNASQFSISVSSIGPSTSSVGSISTVATPISTSATPFQFSSTISTAPSSSILTISSATSSVANAPLQLTSANNSIFSSPSATKKPDENNKTEPSGSMNLSVTRKVPEKERLKISGIKTSSNVFGSATENIATTKFTTFNADNVTDAAPSTKIFGSKVSNAPTGIFGIKNKPASDATPTMSTANLFGPSTITSSSSNISSTKSTATSSIFTFGMPTSTSTSQNPFGTNTSFSFPVVTSNSNTINTDKSASASTLVNPFGSTNSNTSSGLTPGFNFGKALSTTATPSMGDSKTTEPPAAATIASNMFTFGKPTSTITTPSLFPLSTSVADSKTNLFSKDGSTSSAVGIFGAPATTTTSSIFNFGKGSVNTNSNIFGSGMTSSTASNSNPSSNLFSLQPTNPTANMFGSSITPAPHSTENSLSSTTSQLPGAGNTFIFGSNSSQPSTGASNLFGGKDVFTNNVTNTQGNVSTGIFDQIVSLSNGQAANSFGALLPASTSKSLFESVTSTATTAAGNMFKTGMFPQNNSTAATFSSQPNLMTDKTPVSLFPTNPQPNNSLTRTFSGSSLLKSESTTEQSNTATQPANQFNFSFGSSANPSNNPTFGNLFPSSAPLANTNPLTSTFSFSATSQINDNNDSKANQPFVFGTQPFSVGSPFNSASAPNLASLNFSAGGAQPNASHKRRQRGRR